MASKTKIAPLKKQSIPRLELLGATILARLAKTAQNALPQKLETVYWVDSVQEIRESTTPASWNFCPGEQNPADIPSRGLTASELVTEDKW